MPARPRRVHRRAELSWHFLRKGALAASLVSDSSVGRSDLVVEIGAGRGAITRELARRCGRLLAVEIDSELCRGLREEFAREPHVEIVEGDFLEIPLPGAAYKVFGNVPFRHTAGILRRLSSAPVPPADAWLVLQREAAERFAGGPYGPESVVSLLLKPWWQVEIARRLRATDFDPPPAVECVVLWLARRTRPLVQASARPLYGDFVEAAFGWRGPRVRDGLRGVLSHPQQVRLGHHLRFDPGAPATALSFDQWLGLFRFVASRADPRARERLRALAAQRRARAARGEDVGPRTSRRSRRRPSRGSRGSSK